MNRAGLLRAGISHATHSTTKHAAKGTAPAEELCEKVLGVHPTTGTALFQPFFSILIVQLTLLGVGQDLIGMRQILELLGGFRVVRVLVFYEAS